jgi:ABC-type antimicrobial peptide transport system permease subunit
MAFECELADDVEADYANLRAFNRYIEDDWGFGGDGRIVAPPYLPMLDPDLAVADVRTMDDVVRGAMATPRFTGVLLGTFAVLAMLLSAIGIYGVLAFVVSRRTREIGIRVAIGAGRSTVLRMVLANGVGMALMGVAIGAVAALALTRLLRGLLHGVSAQDPVTFAGAASALVTVALVAGLVPAWRATRVDPVIALKSE